MAASSLDIGQQLSATGGVRFVRVRAPAKEDVGIVVGDRLLHLPGAYEKGEQYVLPELTWLVVGMERRRVRVGVCQKVVPRRARERHAVVGDGPGGDGDRFVEALSDKGNGSRASRQLAGSKEPFS